MMTGIGTPFSIFWVCALIALQNSMMCKPRWPSAGPIGGDGLAAPAGTCSLRNPATFFATDRVSFLWVACRPGRTPGGPETRLVVRILTGQEPPPHLPRLGATY